MNVATEEDDPFAVGLGDGEDLVENLVPFLPIGFMFPFVTQVVSQTKGVEIHVIDDELSGGAPMQWDLLTMKVIRDERSVWDGLGSCGAVNEARDHGVELVAPVVSPGEAGEVALGMIGAELAVGSGDRALDVAERRVDPFEGRHAGGLPPGAGADRAMASDDPVERVPAAQAVGEDLAIRGPASAWRRARSRACGSP